MRDLPEFDLTRFLPYLAAQAADVLSLEFQKTYKGKYGMLRTEWRVLFHLGQFGEMTAKEICDRARLHKTKVSRAVAALERKRFLARTEVAVDRRHALLKLTRAGQAAFADLRREARSYETEICSRLSTQEVEVLKSCLSRLAGLPPGPSGQTLGD